MRHGIMNKKAFSLLEVIISAIIIVLGITSLSLLAFSVRFFLKQSERKFQATNLITNLMESKLLQSYANLPDGVIDDPNPGDDYTLGGTIETRYAIGPTAQIPYKWIEVTGSYVETDAKQQNPRTKEIRMVNIVPYPYMHSKSVDLACPSAPVPNSYYVPRDTPPSPPITYSDIGDGLEITFNYETAKDLLVIYNIALAIEDETGIEEADTVYTGVFLNNEANPRPVVTRTPIMSQPLINNVIAINNLSANQAYRVRVKWAKQTNTAPGGSIRLREANMMIVATESP